MGAGGCLTAQISQNHKNDGDIKKSNRHQITRISLEAEISGDFARFNDKKWV